ncbi:FdhF/YdeP family oxidoreductase [Sandaracinobacteroides hominis]|uniref:FdhF/YdeP family oxidoreductase n=1 Tax=Sandaracinobacteroides hominis TaxID=2780086 RepID=UPI0018F2C9BA|nr:FdhF/YdeP family oxidoreductase [Sandaracinobacteroides hominis]
MSDRIPIGGGLPKIAYAAGTVAEIGFGKAAKALTAHNSCKACGLGMGGQKGGMTNEQGDFPSVCNKSIQAQSTDIQPGIPLEKLTAPLAQLRRHSGRELEHLGRLDTPIYKPAGAHRFQPLSWEEAMAKAAEGLARATPARSFFYSSGRSSNEAGFLFQLLARAWGTSNVMNCSWYCHQATSEGLKGTIGTGTATVELADLDSCDFLLLAGANPASNHPRFVHKLKGIRDRGGEVVVMNPAREPGLVRFALPKSIRSLARGGDHIASDWLQPMIGGDLAVLKGLAKALLESGREARAFVAAHTADYEAFALDLATHDWPSIEAASGVSRADIQRIAAKLAGAKSAVFAWGMGITHHRNGVDTVEYLANLALLSGNIGRPGAGLLPLRGHSNVQGIGTIGVKPVLPAEVLDAMEARFGLKLSRTAGFDTMAAMQAAHAGRIDAAILMGGNLYESNPDSQWAREAMSRIGFQLALTTTLNRGHVHGLGDGESLILPVTARDEEWEPTTQESMFNYVRLSDGGIRRHAHTRPESVVLADLAQRLMPASPIDWPSFARHRELRQAIAAVLPEMAELADIDVARQEFHIRGRLLHTPEFHTADGKAHFACRPTPAPRTGLTLATIRSEGQFNTIIYEERDSYRATTDRWTILMREADIAAHGFQPGDRADLVSSQGRMKSVRLQAFDVSPGTVLAYYPEANILTATDTDPRSKTPAFKATPVRLEPAST